jgi:putative transcriptional regulator
MKDSQHHPLDELLSSFSAGSLPLSRALCISTHLEHCQSCSTKLRSLNQLGSELMQQLKPARVSDSLKLSVMDRLDTLIEETPEINTEQPQSLPHCLRQFVNKSYQDLEWKRISTDIHRVELCRDENGAKVELLKIQPNGSAGTHTHLGDEYTVILEGSFSDESGVYRQGDFLVRDPYDKHTPVATQDRPCICLAVTEGPVQFTGIFSRLLNPFIRRGYA